MSTTFFLEAILGTGAGLSVLVFAVVQSLNLKLSRQLSPGNTVVHTQDASEAWWTVASVWFYGLTLIGESGQIKHMRTEDYRLLNNVSGPVWTSVEIAVPAELFAEYSLEAFDRDVANSVVESAKAYLAEDAKDTIAVILKDLERAYTFEIRFAVEHYADKRYAEAIVRRALASLFRFADRAVLAANIVVER